MTRQSILDTLGLAMPELRRSFGVTSLSLFGSAARDEAREGSDIDILVEFDRPATFHNYFDLKFRLEELLCRPVDLVTDKALRAELRPRIERELIHVA
jgi:hypothetical protein